MPASRRARATTLAPRSCPSRPGFATSTRIFFSSIMPPRVNTARLYYADPKRHVFAPIRAWNGHSASHLQFWSFPAWRSNLKICYPFLMQSPREDWLRWVDTLRRYQVDGFVSWLLDAGRPLAILAAQILYLGRPFIGETAQTLGHMLESDEESQEFAALLNGGTP